MESILLLAVVLVGGAVAVKYATGSMGGGSGGGSQPGRGLQFGLNFAKFGS